MAHEPKALQAVMMRAAPPDLELAFRPMFGGIMGYAEGRAFASLSDVGLALKLFGAERDALLAMEGAKPLQYEPHSPPSKSYVVTPEAMLADAEALRGWIRRSAATAKTAPPAKPRVKRSAGRGEERT